MVLKLGNMPDDFSKVRNRKRRVKSHTGVILL